MNRRQRWPRLSRIVEWFGRRRSERRHRREMFKQNARNARRRSGYCPYKGKRWLDRIFFS